MEWSTRLSAEGRAALEHISITHEQFGTIPRLGDNAVWGHFVGHIDWSTDSGRLDLACILAETVHMQCWDRDVLETFFGFVWGVANKTPTRILSQEEWVVLFQAVGYVGLIDELPPPEATVALVRGAYCLNGAGMSWTTSDEVAWAFPESDPGHAIFRVMAEPARVLARFRQGQEDEYVLYPCDLQPVRVAGRCLNDLATCDACGPD